MSTVFFSVALLAVLYGLLGVLNPEWNRFFTTDKPSRMSCALSASLVPLPAMFIGDRFYSTPESADMFVVMMVLIVIVGSISFYIWGVVGTKNYLQRTRNFGAVLGVLVGCVLAVVPVIAFVCIAFAAGVSNDPDISWGVQLSFLIFGLVILSICMAIFDTSTVQTSDLSASDVMDEPFDMEEMEGAPDAAEYATTTQSWLFNFTYTEDDGLLVRVDALISTAETDPQGRRYIRGECAETHAPRLFWLGRILGPMTGPVEEDSTGDQWEASEVFEQLLVFQSAESEA